MTKPDYNWKRFWCPRSGRLNLGDRGGYLADPEAKYGYIGNPDVVRFEAIDDVPCLILLGEPGIGKSHALLAAHNNVVRTTANQGNQTLLLDLRSYGDENRLIRNLFEHAEAGKEGLTPNEFLTAVNQRDMIPLAIKPITFKLLFNRYKRHNGQCPSHQKLWELYLEGFKELCEEPKDKKRPPQGKIANLNVQQRIMVAARIAAVTVLGNRFAVWTGPESDRPDEDVSIQNLLYGHETVLGIQR